MKIYFSHGKKGIPWGKKIKMMSERAKTLGFDIESIDYTATIDPDERANKLTNILIEEKDKYILVGSSMGAYVSLVASENVKNKPQGIFLMAPAIFLPGYKIQTFNTKVKLIELIHGWNDETVPYLNSINFSEKIKCTLHLINTNHRFENSLDEIMVFFDNFLSMIMNN